MLSISKFEGESNFTMRRLEHPQMSIESSPHNMCIEVYKDKPYEIVQVF